MLSCATSERSSTWMSVVSAEYGIAGTDILG